MCCARISYSAYLNLFKFGQDHIVLYPANGRPSNTYNCYLTQNSSALSTHRNAKKTQLLGHVHDFHNSLFIVSFFFSAWATKTRSDVPGIPSNALPRHPREMSTWFTQRDHLHTYALHSSQLTQCVLLRCLRAVLELQASIWPSQHRTQHCCVCVYIHKYIGQLW